MASRTHIHHWFGCSWFARLMSTLGGRLGRGLAGITLIAGGLGLVGGLAGIALAAVGAVPLVAGVLNLCILSAMFGGPLHGSAIRACTR